MEKMRWTDRVINEELHGVKEKSNILHTIKRRKAKFIGHTLRRNCLLKYVIEGKIEGIREVTGRRRKRRKQLLDDLNEKRGFCKLKKEALARTLWRTHFERVYGLAVRQTTE
jgi:tRNA pseudouridine-54 N-methylase